MTNKQISVQYVEKHCVRNISDYYQVGHERWKDAMQCFDNGNYLISLYLAGYSVECILKYVILEYLYSGSKNLNLKDTALKKKGHKLHKLVEIGGQKNIFKVPKESDFQEVVQWTSEWRYATVHNINQEIAEKFLKDVVRISEQLKKEVKGRINMRAFTWSAGGE